MPPPNFWGDAPEEEYYTSQGVRNTQSFFETPHGKIFTQSFLPLDRPIKATVFMSHGYGSDTGWLFQKICIHYATWGYAVFAADLLGHGRSDGLRCYLGDMEKVASASLAFFVSVRRSEEYKHLPAFLFGESMGGAATMLMYFQSEPDTWTGLIFSAPALCRTRKHETVKGTSIHVRTAIRASGHVACDARQQKWWGGDDEGDSEGVRTHTEQLPPGDSAFSYRRTAQLMASRAPPAPRCCTTRRRSEDKTLKIYEGMYHSLIQGEPDENANLVLGDMREWIDERVERYGAKV
ncbi:lysophospholipase 2 [Actinidia rufa]|uniref:Lysophospholipase 2 n=1 Tax=Actinidia rufa TaxID=165716 RepID=A0A7J0FZH6_9ERIC|nr:lysophospholipase 2 [Actinidia rufa]